MAVQYLENPPRDVVQSLLRGARKVCPVCGAGRLFTSYLKVVPACAHCGEALHHHRADDAPPYFTILIVGHIVVPLSLMVETFYRPSMWVHAALWLPLTLIAALTVLPIVKGALVNLQWALYMHGFDPKDRDDEGVPNGS